ncbi:MULTISPECIES: mycofactocin-coupled SDR family oxidoreductase [Gordonia]|uniref:Mycofactocin-coupled SDR family oxidoreductase n=1 Tax=Gordonia hankookensis TaxID=589403 RepID=A0ABR7W9X6_9ACTN|nr:MULTISPECIES: mycofactocin-coupled SDR family oxidoreductase [Gordonia]MBD1319563.1 mycofactocin-coupled SDR family oxidoreductase [Gordonia hankookensis]NDZ96016.1 mycofactocin-coupled SDR family oxidoreductase [Streptomyces sp. SID11726]NEB23771.1 mycofactocin-coupled SDR family oxidoreductase [Streptomyces sp. SID6673]WAC54051.1 mycofactocin-coupled SDR family oxidoreductase [Gordonia sp. SL306]
MTGRVDGKVAFITGAGRGQGRTHAVRLAAEGADIIAIDVCEPIDGVPFDLATEDDLAETAELVKAHDRRVVTAKVDVRDLDALTQAVQTGVDQLGRLDIVAANAGIATGGSSLEDMDRKTWQDMIDVNMTGVWHTAKAAIPHIVAGGRGGSIVLTSSVGGLKSYPFCGHYVTAKHGVIGIMRTLAIELAQNNIRVNSVHPTQVNTAMIMNDATYKMFRPDLENPGPDDFAPLSQMMNTLPVPWVEPEDISNAVLFLASDEARYITGVTLPVDAGACLK